MPDFLHYLMKTISVSIAMLQIPMINNLLGSYTVMGHCFSHGHSTFLKRHQIYCILCESFQYAPVEIPNKVYFREQTICKIGLLNMGSTCFMNSILHVLINSPVLQLASQFRNCSTSSCKLVTRFDEVKDTSSLVEANFNR